MFDCILITLDGSQESEVVLPVVEKLLSTSPAKVVMLRVAPEVSYVTATREYAAKIDPEMLAASTDIDALYADKERELTSYLRTAAIPLEKAGATSVVFEYSFNDPVTEILNCVKRYNVKLIAMATHGRKGLNRLIHGSITESVLHHAPCPMLIVRTGPVEALSEDERVGAAFSNN